MPGKHAPFAPSSLSRIAACPGSYKACLGLPEEQSEYAKEGTLAHSIAEAYLRNYIAGDIVERIPASTSEEMDEAVKVYTDHVRALIDEHKKDGAVGIEKSVTAVKELCWGTADAIIGQSFGTLYVIDLKYGKGIPVDPKNNLQCAAYLIGALYEHKDLMPLRAEIHIVQPRINPEPKVWAIDDVQAFVQEWRNTISDIIDAASQENPKFCPGTHCNFCKAKLRCEALKEQSKELALNDYTSNVLTVTDAPTEELVKFHEKAKAVEIFLKAVASELHTRAQNGETIPGHKLVNHTGNPTWTTDEETLVKKFRSKKLKQDDYYTRKLRTPTQLKKRLGEEFITEHAARPGKGTILVPESDKRQPVLPAKAAEDFDNEGLF